MSRLRYLQAGSLASAAQAVQTHRIAEIVAGGTDLLQRLEDNVLPPELMVDITSIEELRGIEVDGDRVRLGALVRLSEVIDDPLLQEDFPVIVEALLATASPQVRNLATVGGNPLQKTRCLYFRDQTTPCNKREPGTGCSALEGRNRVDAVLGGSEHCIATHASDFAVAMAALDATVVVGSAKGERFGWDERDPRRRSMQHNGMLVGYGMASALWPAMRAPAAARLTLFANGTAVVRTGASDMGPGTYTSMTQVAADQLGLPIERVTFELGDSALPMAPVHGRSITMASVGNAVAKGCARSSSASPTRKSAKTCRKPCASSAASGSMSTSRHRPAMPQISRAMRSARSSPRFTSIRSSGRWVPRIIAAYDGGRIVNPLTAQSQAIGGLVQGIGMALLEGGEWDDRLGRVMNANLAEYLVPVNADVGQLDVTFVPGDDRRFNPLGVKGIAEVSLCGVAPAIANAVWHATDIRVRDLPLTPDKLLDAGLR